MTKIISFEGFEYSGKSTQINLLKKYFIKNKIKSEFTREPGGIKDLEKIRKIIINSNFTNKSQILFFFASRFELISKMTTMSVYIFTQTYFIIKIQNFYELDHSAQPFENMYAVFTVQTEHFI